MYKARIKAIQILDLLEEILGQHNIKIPDKERENREEEACIYGETYYYLEDQITKIIGGEEYE